MAFTMYAPIPPGPIVHNPNPDKKTFFSVRGININDYQFVCNPDRGRMELFTNTNRLVGDILLAEYDPSLPIKVPKPPPLRSSPRQRLRMATQDSSPKVLTRKTLQDLVKEVDPNEQLDEDVEELLLGYAEEFMEELIEGACSLAKHRKGTSVEGRDVQAYLEKNCNIWLPGFGSDELRPYKRAPTAEAHKQRQALIKKTVKKY